tara:strand:- start:55 stop:198 length:144 start_codon:yes stop_codon:yes gene_type:complete
LLSILSNKVKQKIVIGEGIKRKQKAFFISLTKNYGVSIIVGTVFTVT